MKIERLRSLREKRGLSQGEAAKKMGIVRTTYSNYEAGNREPDNDTLRKFSEFFEVSIDYLLGNDEVKRVVSDEGHELYDQLPLEDKLVVDSMIKALLNKRR